MLKELEVINQFRITQTKHSDKSHTQLVGYYAPIDTVVKNVKRTSHLFFNINN